MAGPGSWGWRLDGSVLHVGLLRVANSLLAGTLSRLLARIQRETAVAEGASLIRISDRQLTPLVRAGLMQEGLVANGETWWAPVLSLCETSGDAAALLATIDYPHGADPLVEILCREVHPSAAKTADLERWAWPLKICHSDLPTFLVPTLPSYAQELFDTELSSQSLFFRPANLGLSCEHIYYRKQGFSNGLTAPARILWYVAAGAHSRGTKAVKACSLLEEIVVDYPDRLHHRFEHLGVFSLEQVKGAASKSGRAMALRFSRTELFRNPVAYGELTKLAVARGETLILQSPRPVSPALFRDIYTKGMLPDRVA